MAFAILSISASCPDSSSLGVASPAPLNIFREMVVCLMLLMLGANAEVLATVIARMDRMEVFMISTGSVILWKIRFFSFDMIYYLIFDAMCSDG